MGFAGETSKVSSPLKDVEMMLEGKEEDYNNARKVLKYHISYAMSA